MLGRPLDEILRYRCKIIMRSCLFCLPATCMPDVTIFSAAADMGQHGRPALFQPPLADSGPVAGCHWNREAAILIEMDRRIPRPVGRADLRIRNVCTVR